MHDVAVVGGGPAGLHVAALLAGRGFDVAVFEEHQAIGEPVHCTGLIATETYDEFRLSTESVLNDVRSVSFYPPTGERVEYTTDRAEALVVDRHLFDRQLAERARERGAAIRVGVKIRSIELAEESVSIHCADRDTLRARVCILACGANYSLHRRVGLGLPTVFLQSAQMELAAATSGPVEVHFGDRVAPRGFAWAVPVDFAGERRIRVGLMCAENAAWHFQRFLAGVGSRRGIACPAGTPRLKMLPLAPIPRTFGHRLLAIGDAAGLVKATTGGGVYYGLVSASIAADVLARALARDELSEASLGRYEAGWRKRLGAELEAQLSLRSIAQRLSDEEIEGLFELARTDGVMPIVRRTARFNEHRELIVSLLKHPPVRKLLYRQLATRAWHPARLLGPLGLARQPFGVSDDRAIHARAVGQGFPGLSERQRAEGTVADDRSPNARLRTSPTPDFGLRPASPKPAEHDRRFAQAGEGGTSDSGLRTPDYLRKDQA